MTTDEPAAGPLFLRLWKDETSTSALWLCSPCPTPARLPTGPPGKPCRYEQRRFASARPEVLEG